MTLSKKNQVKIQQNPLNIQAIQSLKSNSQLETINLIVNQALYYNGNYYESEATIARRLGISVTTVARAVKTARLLHIIKRKRRFNDSNVYSVNPLLRRPEIIDMLAAVLPALRNLLCLSFLLPIATILKPASILDLHRNDKLYIKDVYLKDSPETLIYNSKEDSTWHLDQEWEEELKRENLSDEAMQIYNKFVKTEEVVPEVAYIDQQTATEYKEFMNERLARLVESINGLELSPEKKQNVIEQQVNSYVDRLHWKDVIRLRKEGYPL